MFIYGPRSADPRQNNYCHACEVQYIQKAQRSQICHATLYVAEKFKLLKITRNDTVEQEVWEFLLV